MPSLPSALPERSALDLSSSANLDLDSFNSAPQRQAAGAIGRKGGARMLASEEAVRAQERAAGYVTDDFSLNSKILSSVESSPNPSQSPTPILRRIPLQQAASYPLSESHVDPQALRKEGNMNELTRRASAEDELIRADQNSSPARARTDSVLKGVAAGLGTPFVTPAGSAPAPVKREEPPSPAPKRHPPVSGDNYSRREMRSRSASVGSTGSSASINKDTMLQQLADALKSERRRNKLYEEEILLAEEEVDYFTREIEIVKEKFSTRFEQQEQTIKALRAEVDEVKSELETAYDLDPDAAEAFLSLLSSRPSPTKGPVVQAFAPSALHDSSPATAVDSKSKVKPSKAKRRVDAHIAAHNDSSDAERGMTQPKGSLWRRGRKLSKSTRPPLVETISLPTLQNLQGEEGAPPHVLGSRMGAAESTPDLVKPFPILKAEKEKKRPPVSGENHLTGVGEEVRTRKRTNSFKKGLAGTLRVMFPSNAPTSNSSKPSADSLYPDAPPPDADKVQAWLTQGGRGSDGRTKVGTGYSNPFDSR